MKSIAPINSELWSESSDLYLKKDKKFKKRATDYNLNYSLNVRVQDLMKSAMLLLFVHS